MQQFKEVLLFALPCWIANMSLNLIYIIKYNIPFLGKYDVPLDGFLKLSDRKRFLGNSTTLPGIAMSIIIAFILSLAFKFTFQLSLLITLSVYCGHALGSFIKRRAGLNDGQFMPVVDHGDYILLTGLILGLMNYYSWSAIGLGVLITYIVHPIVTYLAFLLKLHKYPK